MPQLNPSIFREYDIRGRADQDLSNELVTALGRAFTSVLGVNAPRVAVGRDCRLSSLRIRDALVHGLEASGAHVIDIGVVPSPALYFSAHHLKTDGAIIITGSHNPSPDNGFKLLKGTDSIHGQAIQTIKETIENALINDTLKSGSTRHLDIQKDYLAAIRESLNLGTKRFKVVVDAGNGTGGPLAIALLNSLGFETHPLYCEMDGRFPNHHPDPTIEENLSDLKAAVVQHGADVGLAFDGDADRLGAVDGKGRVLWGDQLMILFGKSILQEKPGATFIAEVKCSEALYDELTKAGGNPIMWKVGHSLIKSKLKETGAALAGEMSGHLFFADRYFGFDDAIYAGARLLELLSKSDKNLCQLYDELPIMVNTPEIRVPCPDHQKFGIILKIKERLKTNKHIRNIVDIDGVRAQLDHGWGLVRASNTQASLVTRYEATDDAHLKTIQTLFENVIRESKQDLGLL